MAAKKRSTTEERLRELLDRRDEEIAELKEKLAKEDTKIREIRARMENYEGGWACPTKDAEDIPELPVPRLEFRWHKMYRDQREKDWSTSVIIYQLVMRHSAGHLVEIPLGVTRRTGNASGGTGPWDTYGARAGTVNSDGDPIPRADLPSHDGGDSHHDAAHFNLPLYGVFPDGGFRRLDGDPYYAFLSSLGAKHRREP